MYCAGCRDTTTTLVLILDDGQRRRNVASLQLVVVYSEHNNTWIQLLKRRQASTIAKRKRTANYNTRALVTWARMTTHALAQITRIFT